MDEVCLYLGFRLSFILPAEIRTDGKEASGFWHLAHAACLIAHAPPPPRTPSPRESYQLLAPSTVKP